MSIVSRCRGANGWVRTMTSYVNQEGEKKQEYDFTNDYSIVSQTQTQRERERQADRQTHRQGRTGGENLLSPVALRCGLLT